LKFVFVVGYSETDARLMWD